jgi:NADPH2:quinone reductase
LWPLVESGRVKPTVYNQIYSGLESVPKALKDIAGRKVWGKAVIQVDQNQADERGQKAKI